MIESIERIMVMLQAMNKEKKTQNAQMIQRISAIEEQLRDSDSKDDVRDAQIRGVNARIYTANRNLRQSDWEGLRWRRLD